jgi:hypothetical protein
VERRGDDRASFVLGELGRGRAALQQRSAFTLGPLLTLSPFTAFTLGPLLPLPLTALGLRALSAFTLGPEPFTLALTAFTLLPLGALTGLFALAFLTAGAFFPLGEASPARRGRQHRRCTPSTPTRRREPARTRAR